MKYEASSRTHPLHIGIGLHKVSIACTASCSAESLLRATSSCTQRQGLGSAASAISLCGGLVMVLLHHWRAPAVPLCRNRGNLCCCNCGKHGSTAEGSYCAGAATCSQPAMIAKCPCICHYPAVLQTHSNTQYRLCWLCPPHAGAACLDLMAAAALANT